MTNLVALHAIVCGQVQGVFFRAFVSEHAAQLGLTGFVRNLPSGREVEVQAEGDQEKLEKLVGYLKSGPKAARVAKVETTWREYTGQYSRFEIRY